VNGRIKRPAYQWYPADADSDEVFRLMTYEQEGIYRRLLDHQWMEGSIPRDPQVLASLLPKMDKARFLEIWPLVSGKFRPRGSDRLVNDRLEAQRKERDRFVKTQQANIRKRWDRKALQQKAGDTTVLPSNYSSTSSSTSSSTVEQKEQGSAPTRTPARSETRIPAIGHSPSHRTHACCGKMCLHESQYLDFAKRVSHLSDPTKYVGEWFTLVNARYTIGDRKDQIIGEDMFDFWRKRWEESHPATALKPAVDVVELARKRIDANDARYGKR
jgi:uncharacterized protein YdaU (DUF1376 family)